MFCLLRLVAGLCLGIAPAGRGTRLLQNISSVGDVLALLLILMATWIHTRARGAVLQMPATVLNVVVVYGLRRHSARNPRTRNLLRVRAALLRSLVIFLTRLFPGTTKKTSRRELNSQGV